MCVRARLASVTALKDTCIVLHYGSAHLTGTDLTVLPTKGPVGCFAGLLVGE